MMTQSQATAAGEALLAEVAKKYDGFKLRVWENIGWHFSVDNGYVCVSRSRARGGSGQCSALLMPHYTYYGMAERHNDPTKAIAAVVALLKRHVDAETEKLAKLAASLKGRKL